MKTRFGQAVLFAATYFAVTAVLGGCEVAQQANKSPAAINDTAKPPADISDAAKGSQPPDSIFPPSSRALPDAGSPYVIAAREQFLLYVVHGTRVEVVLIRETDDGKWQRIGPFIIDSDTEITELRDAVLDYDRVIANPSPFAGFDNTGEFEMNWMVTKPPISGTGRAVGLNGGAYFTFERSESKLIVYKNRRRIFELLERIATSRASQGKAFVLEVP